ncbi:signal peptidase I [Sporosarcina sp. 179-K 8C2 HS]|uniref:signal peptidase I n=1 Tax=Sporosarcina sp. 179-K 8C2 HS TaxID=3142387 RepID=UPI0039A22185
MKLFSKLLNAVLAIGILCTLIAAVGSAITGKPVLLTVIRSNSMYPVWERGDMVIINNLQEKDQVENGDIIFFKTEKGSLANKGWIAHRVIDGNAEQGFVTKGDANKTSDQQDGAGMIERQMIAGKAFTIGTKPIVIPKLGYLSLWAEKYQSSPYTLPAIAVVIAIIIGIGELLSGKKKHRKKNKGMDLQLIYIVGGLTIAVIMGATMLASSQTLKLVYQVSEDSQGVLMGSAVGILKVGETVTNPLSDLSNGGFFKLIGAITTNDKQVTLSHNSLSLSPGQKLETEFTVNAETPGSYDTTIKVGLFYPFLPSSLIYFLAQKSYWIALATVSLVPGLPLIVYPFIDGRMRRKMINVVRKKKRRMRAVLPF